MATGVCRICGNSFSSWDINETVCPKCRYEKNWERICNGDTTDTPLGTNDSVTPYTPSVSFDNIVTTAPALTVDSTVHLPTELIIEAQKIVLKNGGIRLVVDNDTIKNIDSIEVNGIKFERVKE